MDSSQIITGVAALVIGAGLGFGAAKIIGPDTTPTASKPPTIQLTEATSLIQNYITLGRPLNSNLFAFAVDTAQVNLMTKVMSNDATIPGFRIYLASNSRSVMDKACVIFPLDRTGADNQSAIYKSTGPHIGPCPNVCDKSAMGQ